MSARPLSNAIWPSSFSDTRDEMLLKVNPSRVGVSEMNRRWNVPLLEPTNSPCWNVSSSSGTIAALPNVFTDWSATRNSEMKLPPGGLMVCAIVVSGPPLPRNTPCRRARWAGVPHSALVVSRRRFPWKPTSPSSLIDGSDGRLTKPLSQNVGKSATGSVSATTTGRSLGAPPGDDSGDAGQRVLHRHRDGAERVDRRAARRFEAVPLAVEQRRERIPRRRGPLPVNLRG